MMTCRAFKLYDLGRITPIEAEVPHEIRSGNHLLSGTSYTLMDGKKIMACGGVMETPPGVGTAWIHLDKCVLDKQSRLIYIFRASGHAVLVAHIVHHMRRVQASAFASNHKAIKWLERLGFEREGVMRYMGREGEDAILFAHYGDETKDV